MTTPTQRLRVVSGHLTSPPSSGPVSARLTSRAAFTRANVLAALDLHGYCILERYVDDPAALRRDFDSTLLPRTPTGRNRFEGSKTRRCYSLFAKTRAFDAIACDPLLLDCVGAALGSEQAPCTGRAHNMRTSGSPRGGPRGARRRRRRCQRCSRTAPRRAKR